MYSNAAPTTSPTKNTKPPPTTADMGINRATSTSKSKNRIATSQNLGQNGTVIIPEGSNPHSNGAAALLGRDAKTLLKQGTTTTNTAATRPIILILTITLGVKKRCFQSTPPTNTKRRTAPRQQALLVEATFRPGISTGRSGAGGESRAGPGASLQPRYLTPKHPLPPTSRSSALRGA